MKAAMTASSAAPGMWSLTPYAGWTTNKNRQTPFFIWIHLYDPHAPYDPPAPFDKRFTDLYDGEVAYADASLGKLFSYLRQHGLYDRALITMMSDHGESLGAHGESMHGIFLYDETIRVPLLFKLPGELLAGRRVASPGAAGGRGSHASQHVELAAAAHLSGRVSGAHDEGEAAAAGKGESKTCGRSAGLCRDRLPASGVWLEFDPLHAHRQISFCAGSAARTL